MKVSVILAHPNQKSFNHAIARTVVNELNKNEHDIYHHDLYSEKFNPVLESEEIPKYGKVEKIIQNYCKEISESEGLVVIHPNWWGQPPAILKGWIDRVLRPGVAYEFLEDDKGDGIPVGLLKCKAAIVFNTSNTPTKREMEVFGDPLERIWKDCIFNLCGVRNFYRKTFNVIVTSSADQRKIWLEEIGVKIRNIFPKDQGEL